MKWYDMIPDERGITSIAYHEDFNHPDLVKIKGYNGIERGNAVLYKGKPFIVTLVSTSGHFGLLEYAGTTYSEFVRPSEVEKI